MRAVVRDTVVRDAVVRDAGGGEGGGFAAQDGGPGSGCRLSAVLVQRPVARWPCSKGRSAGAGTARRQAAAAQGASEP
ncbi:hypothetical protein [Streptomyces anulatus]|uniref:hypothetical protein n=1 Tax=Streptomyces anulatus TaxID=1892 RepID=UPI003416320C